MWEEGEWTRNQMKLTEENNRRAAEERSRNNSSQSGGGSSSGGGIVDTVKLLFFGMVASIVIGIVYAIYKFIQAFWVYIVIVLGICIVCAIVCVIISKKAQKPGLKTLFAILASAGLIFAVFFFDLPKMNKIPKMVQNVTTPQRELTITTIYANVVSDVLNVRSGPSAEQDIVGQLAKDARVEVIDSSGQWWKIKSGNIEGYVNSDFLGR